MGESPTSFREDTVEHLELPSQDIWQQRRDWFEREVRRYEEEAAFLVSEQACALIAEAQSCFCAGAWISVIVLAFTVIDAQLRETELPDFKGSSKKLFEELGFDSRFQKLRERRNRIIHLNPDAPAITVDQQWSNRDELEVEAREAVLLMLEAFFSNPAI